MFDIFTMRLILIKPILFQFLNVFVLLIIRSLLAKDVNCLFVMHVYIFPGNSKFMYILQQRWLTHRSKLINLAVWLLTELCLCKHLQKLILFGT